MNVECNQGALEELESAFRFNDAVLRNLVIKRKTAITKPSPLVKGEDDNESRGGDEAPRKPRGLPKDEEMISKEPHELNYVLKKFGKRQTATNRDKFEAILDQFRANDSYAPHLREDFYRYLDDNNAFADMESLDA
jgi:hypothetical protein